MDYNSLIAPKPAAGALASWVNYAQLDAVTIVAEAQALLYARLRTREMRALDTSIAIATNDSVKALPASFLELIRPLRDNQNNFYVLKTQGELMMRRAYDGNGNLIAGQPIAFAIFGEALNFDAAFVAGGMTLQLMCYKSLPLLSVASPSNFLTSRYPHLLRRACLMLVADFMADDQAYARNLAKLEADIETVNAENQLIDSGVELDTHLRI
jgi:hypothetical protein